MYQCVIVEDELLARCGIRSMVEGASEQVEVLAAVSNGRDALALFEALPSARPDILITDLRMPGIDGVALARKIKDSGLPTSSLMLTSYDAQQYVMASLRAGARGYVLKTASMETLSKAIRIVARGGFYLDSEVANAVEEEGEFVPEPVSVREREVLLLAARGLSGKEIATQLFISERTVQTHLASIYDKLGAKNKTEAMLLSLKYGIVTLEELLD